MDASLPHRAPLQLETDVLRPSALRRLLDELGFRPSKVLGQNFLIDRNILGHILDAAALGSGETVLEVGPGAGAITGAMLAGGARVLAVEKDARLCAYLVKRYGGHAGFTLVAADMLDLDPDALQWRDGAPARPSVMVSNLPYGPGNRILLNVLRCRNPPERCVITVQREVAERLAAQPGTHDYGLLSVWVQRLCTVEILRWVGPRCFFPQPEVTSGVVRLVRRADAPATPDAVFDAMTRAAFGQRRRQLARSLADRAGAEGVTADTVRSWLSDAGVKPAARPEELSWEQWRMLATVAGAREAYGKQDDAQGTNDVV